MTSHHTTVADLEYQLAAALSIITQLTDDLTALTTRLAKTEADILASRRRYELHLRHYHNVAPADSRGSVGTRS